jgi:glycosyltransferase involved in cell wall biosynthesis
MRLVFLCKRRPMGRDLFEAPYGRFFHLAKALEGRGHHVTMVLLSYTGESPARRNIEGIDIHSAPLWPTTYVQIVRSIIRDEKPDWIVGCSDTYFGILAERLASRHGLRSLIDAYDNYEGYIPWCKPLHWLWRRALRRATAIAAAGPALLELMARDRMSAHAAVVPMAVDSPLFKPLSRQQCRAELGLPQDDVLIGYSGAVAPNRGLDTLFRAIEILRRDLPNVRLIMSGRRVGDVSLPADTTWLGTLPDESVPKVINAMNVVTVVNRATQFGNYSYPIKLYEAMQCGVPAVATHTPATEWILANAPDFLAAPADPRRLAECIRYALKVERPSYGPLPTWQESGAKLEDLMLGAEKGVQ